jgi:diguanylate cyclase (GGDEF)-like protein
MRERLSTTLPGGVLVLAAVLAVASGIVDDAWVGPLVTYMPVVLLMGALLGLGFRRGRVALASLAIATAYVSLHHLAASSAAAGEAGRFAWHAAAFLLPLNLAVLAAIRERGVFALATLAHTLAIVGQALLVWFLWLSYHPGLVDFLARPVSAEWRDWFRLPLPALVAFVLAIWVAVAALVIRPDPVQAGIMWALVAAFAAFQIGSLSAPAVLMLGAACGVIAVALVQAVLALAFRDTLTGLPNRRALEEALARTDGPCAAAMIDVDHFKGFNDRWGHSIGDQVLRMVASKVGRVQGGGRSFRYGGEEFAVLFPGKTTKEALPYLEAVRREIEQARFAVRAPDRPTKRPRTPAPLSSRTPALAVTVSIGAAHRSNRETSLAELMRAADSALYRAKNSGRNKLST